MSHAHRTEERSPSPPENASMPRALGSGAASCASGGVKTEQEPFSEGKSESLEGKGTPPIEDGGHTFEENEEDRFLNYIHGQIIEGFSPLRFLPGPPPIHVDLE